MGNRATVQLILRHQQRRRDPIFRAAEAGITYSSTPLPLRRAVRDDGPFIAFVNSLL